MLLEWSLSLNLLLYEYFVVSIVKVITGNQMIEMSKAVTQPREFVRRSFILKVNSLSSRGKILKKEGWSTVYIL